jgi:hypothetical protein
MGQLRDFMETDLKLAGYSPSTKKIYLLYARLFARYFMCSPAEMGEPEVRGYGFTPTYDDLSCVRAERVRQPRSGFETRSGCIRPINSAP